MKKSILFLCLFLGISTHLFSQRTITGTITEATSGLPLPGTHVMYAYKNLGTVADTLGQYQIKWDSKKGELIFRFPGCETKILTPGKIDTLNVVLTFDKALVQYDTVITFDPETYEEQIQVVKNDRYLQEVLGNYVPKKTVPPYNQYTHPEWNTEDYSPIVENNEKDPFNDPLSTFSIDVDNASYSNVRRFLNQRKKPPIDAVRIEEMINYFDYDYPQPKGKHPFSITTERSACPWNEDRQLLLIGLQGKKVAYEKLPSANLVFLLDVSGSMQASNKLPLVKSAMTLLVNQLREQDKVAIVVYAGAAGLVLPPTSIADKAAILAAIENLRAGGSTAGGKGIVLAYKTAKDHFIKGGNNRVILATDGDFNIGVSSDAKLTRLIEEKRKENIFLTVLGFGMGNLKDNKLEILADKGNGNYAYIDQLSEAKKVFVQELTANLFTIAKDVKIQVEFNPQFVESYRLVGYENRLLNKEDFNDDTKDAGELGAGHQVTALYELTIRPKKDASPTPSDKSVGLLRFQRYALTNDALKSGDLAHIQLRYKPVDSEHSELISQSISNKKNLPNKVSDSFRLATAVAGFGLILRNSDSNKNMDVEKVKELAGNAKNDPYGYRKELVEMVDKWAVLDLAADK